MASGILEQLRLVEVVPQLSQVEFPVTQALFDMRGIAEGPCDHSTSRRLMSVTSSGLNEVKTYGEWVVKMI